MLRNHHELNEIYKGKIQVGVSAETAVFPTIQECAALASDAYNFDNHKMPPGWSCSIDSRQVLNTNSNYFGKCYVKEINLNNYVVVFSHRGTVFTSVKNLWNDFLIALNHSPSQTIDAFNFVTIVLNRLGWLSKDGIYLRGTVTQTGHSLGAIMGDAASGVLSIAASNEINSVTQCVTFENPGSLKAVTEFWGQIAYPQHVIDMQKFLELRSVSFLRQVDVINTCEPHIGRTFFVNNIDYEDYQNESLLPFPPSVAYDSNLHYLTDYSFDRHSMDKMVKCVNGADFTPEEKIYTSNRQEAYTIYLDPTNTDYWEEYFQSMWDHDFTGLLHLKYDNDIKKAKAALYGELTSVYQDAKKRLSSEKEKSFGNSHNMFKSANDIVKEFHLIEKDDELKTSYCRTM